jgi:hypothetical protein
VKAGLTYNYTVTAIDRLKNESATTNQISVHVQ